MNTVGIIPIIMAMVATIMAKTSREQASMAWKLTLIELVRGSWVKKAGKLPFNGIEWLVYGG